MAAAVALMTRDRGSATPALQVLGIPALDMATEVPAGAGMISPALRGLVRRVYFPDVASRREPYASPLLAPDLSGLPPALVLTAERDTLRADGLRYAERLRAAGVDVWHHETPGVDHYFLTEDPVRARDTMAQVAQRVRAALSSWAGLAGGPVRARVTAMATWADVERLATGLPSVQESTTWGNRCWQVAGKTFVWVRPLGKKDRADLGDAVPEGEILGCGSPTRARRPSCSPPSPRSASPSRTSTGTPPSSCGWTTWRRTCSPSWSPMPGGPGRRSGWSDPPAPAVRRGGGGRPGTPSPG